MNVLPNKVTQTKQKKTKAKERKKRKCFVFYFIVLRVLLACIGLRVWVSEMGFNVSWGLRVFIKPSSVPAMDLAHLAVM